MNQRIQVLAEQCRIEEYNQCGDLMEFGFDEEKFAELLINECAETVQDFVDHRFPASEYPVRLRALFRS